MELWLFLGFATVLMFCSAFCWSNAFYNCMHHSAHMSNDFPSTNMAAVREWSKKPLNYHLSLFHGRKARRDKHRRIGREDGVCSVTKSNWNNGKSNKILIKISWVHRGHQWIQSSRIAYRSMPSPALWTHTSGKLHLAFERSTQLWNEIKNLPGTSKKRITCWNYQQNSSQKLYIVLEWIQGAVGNWKYAKM